MMLQSQSDDHLCNHETDSNQNSSKLSMSQDEEAMSSCSGEYLQESNLVSNDIHAESIPDLSEPVPSSWVTIEDDFVMIHTASQTHLSTSVCFAPDSRLSDGIIWLFYLTSKVSKKNLLQFLSSLEDSGHIKMPFVNIVPVRAFRLKPQTDSGVLSIDGEAMKVEPFQAEVLPGMGRILTNAAKSV